MECEIDITKRSKYLLDKNLISFEQYNNIKIKLVLKLIDENDIKELEYHINKNNIELKELNNDSFNIMNYVSSPSNHISTRVKEFIIEHFDKKRAIIFNLLKEDDSKKLLNYMETQNIEFKQLNDKYFNILEYINNPINNISINMRNFVISHYDRTTCEIIKLIKQNNINNLMSYLEKHDIELESLNNKYFNIINYVIHTPNISYNMKIFVLSHVNKKRYDIVELIRKNNIKNLVKYIEENNIELKEYNDSNFDIISHTFLLYRKYIINCEVKDYVLASFDRKRRKIIENIKNNDLDGLLKCIIENDIKLNELNDQYLNIVSYTCKYLYSIKSEIKKFVVTNQDNKGTQILINLIKKNKYDELKRFVEHNEFSLKSLNNNDFMILDYTENLFKSNKISSEMKVFIFDHYDYKRNKIIDLIHENNIERLKEYFKKNKIIFEEFDDKYFNFKDLSLKLFKKKIISYDVKFFILAHYNKLRNDIINIIQNNDIEELNCYITENDIEVKNVNDEYFNIIKYSLICIKGISVDIIDYLLCHFSKERAKIVELMKSNNFEQLKEYISNQNNEQKIINSKHFDILKYTQYLYNKKKIIKKLGI